MSSGGSRQRRERRALTPQKKNNKIKIKIKKIKKADVVNDEMKEIL